MLTYAGVPYDETGSSGDVAIIGFTSDLGADTNTGQANAPTHLRYHAYLAEGDYPFVPYQGRIVDAGDVVPNTRSNAAYMEDVRLSVADVATNTGIVVGLGGDDSVAYGMALGLVQEYGTLGVAHFDAHTDASEELHDTVAHGNWVRHIRYHVPVVQWGCRESSATPPFNDVIPVDTPLLLVVDMDVFDPAYAPGVAVPVPFGYTPHMVMEQIAQRVRANPQVVGVCINEVAPDRDPRGQTAVLASHLLNRTLALL